MRRSLWFRLYVRISVRSCGSCGVALPHHEVLSIGTCRATRSKGCEKWALGDSTGLWRSLVVLHLCRRSVGLSSVRSGPGLYSQAFSGPLRFSYTPFAIRLLCVVHLCCRFYWLLPCISHQHAAVLSFIAGSIPGVCLGRSSSQRSCDHAPFVFAWTHRINAYLRAAAKQSCRAPGLGKPAGAPPLQRAPARYR